VIKVWVALIRVYVVRCGGSVGMGLWILECYVVLMNAMDLEDVRGCILPAPYLDEYGESDIGLRWVLHTELKVGLHLSIS